MHPILHSKVVIPVKLFFKTFLDTKIKGSTELYDLELNYSERGTSRGITVQPAVVSERGVLLAQCFDIYSTVFT